MKDIRDGLAGGNVNDGPGRPDDGPDSPGGHDNGLDRPDGSDDGPNDGPNRPDDDMPNLETEEHAANE